MSIRPTTTFFLTLWLTSLPQMARPHCDTLDGPVVRDARAALEARDVTPVLKWIRADQEREVREVFEQILAVRAPGGAALALADRLFFETLVRLHREAEGAPFTGLKPAGAVEPGIAAADEALEKGSADSLVSNLTELVERGIRERFEHVLETKRHASETVEKGRAYVAAYVEYAHFVERLHADATGPAGGSGHVHGDVETHLDGPAPNGPAGPQ